MPSKSTASSSANSRRSRNSSSSSINNAEDPENFAQQVCELLSWYILVLPVLYLSYVVASEDTHLSALLGGIASSAAIFILHTITQSLSTACETEKLTYSKRLKTLLLREKIE